MSTLEGPRVFDGRQWVTYTGDNIDVGSPVKQVMDGDGKIFVSIASYRDGERCGETIRSIFSNAANPDNIIIGLAEQNAPEDKFCLEAYCEFFGAKIVKRNTIRQDTTKVMQLDEARAKCPRFQQVRHVAYHHIQARGPNYSRSLTRKVLGNEEFCMQVDAHTEFAKNWDTMVMEEWKNTKNEFGVISNVPAAKSDKSRFMVGSPDFKEVPRQCVVRFLDNGFLDFMSPADGKMVDMATPVLGHTWSAAFSFAKCHLEESAPYDNFLIYAKPLEQVSRYARMWTRGYDVYTPTRNIVFHDYEPQANGHGKDEWFGRQRNRFRQASIARAKTILQLPGGSLEPNEQANLGIYGLGKRRSLHQLQEFMNVDLEHRRGNMGGNMICTGQKLVAFDADISPTENLFPDADHLDPQPEYPLRTNLVYYEQVVLDDLPSGQQIAENNRALVTDLSPTTVDHFEPGANLPSPGILFIVWIFGLFVWYMMFMGNGGSPSHGGSNPKRPKKKGGPMYKDV